MEASVSRVSSKVYLQRKYETNTVELRSQKDDKIGTAETINRDRYV